MSSASTSKPCRFCNAEITPRMVFGKTIICEACGQADTKRSTGELIAKVFFAALTISSLAGFGYYMKDNIRVSLNPSLAFDKMNETQLLEARKACEHRYDEDCSLEVWRRLAKINTGDDIYEANYAFNLTRAHRYNEAQPIYKKILESGNGTYDLMFFYGRNLDGLAQIDEAVKWYEKSLTIVPADVAAVENLAVDYNKQKKPMAALSLMQSFVFRYPEAYGSFAGRISSTLELVSNQEKTESAKIVIPALDGAHFTLPIAVGASSARPFVVDTGATTTLMSTTDARAFFPELMAKSKIAHGQIANGQIIEVHTVKVPELKIGPWTIKNVSVDYCDSCSSLAGMSLLKNFKMQTSNKNNFATLTLSHDE